MGNHEGLVKGRIVSTQGGVASISLALMLIYAWVRITQRLVSLGRAGDWSMRLAGTNTCTSLMSMGIINVVLGA